MARFLPKENKMKLNWNLLNRNLCPKCGRELDYESCTDFVLCTISCGFQISSRKMKMICASQATSELLKSGRIVQDNQAALESLGRSPNPFEEEQDD